VEKIIRQAAKDILDSKYAIALTGAGISTESAIPDFRGPKGLWTIDKQAEAKAYERYELFLRDPRAYWEEMIETRGAYGGFYGKIREAEPNSGHYALADLERMGILKSVITQNIDGLHRKAGNSRVMEYHGSVSKLRCTSCGLRFDLEDVSLEKLPPLCKCGAALKYDVVHFKEPIPPDVMEESEQEALKCDLLLICGTTAVVYPFASLPRVAKFHHRAIQYVSPMDESTSKVKIIEVNDEPTPLTYEGISDYLIQGKTGEILPAIVEEINRNSSGISENS
jgi:NAD-dependent deacetylase